MPRVDLDAVRRHLASFAIICAGGDDAGPIGKLSKRERFDWLVAPRSTIIQTSAVTPAVARMWRRRWSLLDHGAPGARRADPASHGPLRQIQLQEMSAVSTPAMLNVNEGRRAAHRRRRPSPVTTSFC